MNPVPPSPNRSLIWPVAVSLGLLLLGVLVWGIQALPFMAIGLVVVNVVAAIIMAISSRIHYVPALLLAAVVVLLVGFGVCALLLSSH